MSPVMSPARPLVRRRPDGTRYVDPSELPPPRPRYSSGLPPQPGRAADSGPEPTPDATPARSGRRSVSDADVLEVRAEWATGKWKVPDLAYIFGLTPTIVRGIVRGETYRDVKPQPEEQD